MKLTTEKKIVWQYIASTLVLLSGLVLIFLSFFAPPKGAIDASVLTAFGEALSFVGAVWGIAATSTRKIYEIDRKYRSIEELAEEKKD